MRGGLKGGLKRLFVPNSLLYQLLARSLFVLAALLVLIGLLQYWLTKDFLYRNQTKAMEAQMMSLPKMGFLRGDKNGYDDDSDREAGKPSKISETKLFEEGYRQPGANRNERPLLYIPDRSLAFIGLDGSFTDVSAENGMKSPRLSPEEYSRLIETADPLGLNRLVTDDDGVEQWVVIRIAGHSDHPQGLIQMGANTEPLQRQLVQQLLTFITLSVLALGGGLALNASVLKRTLTPLTRIGRVAEQIDAGNLGERFPVQQGQQEIDRLSQSFNGMLERLEVSFEAEREAKTRMQRFIADASHELRTPLTSIHGFLQVLLRGAASNEEQLYGALNSMQGESKRLNKLVEDLLLLAKFDRTPELRRTEIRMDDMLHEMEPQLRVLAVERTVQMEAEEPVAIIGDADKIKQVVLNLFHNAVQHTDPQEGRIVVRLNAQEATASTPYRTQPGSGSAHSRGIVILSVEDNGTGIDEEHLPKIFERFYRSDSARSRKFGGSGLGLAISQSIVEAHGGTIEVASRKGLGSVFTVKLPVGEAEAE